MKSTLNSPWEKKVAHVKLHNTKQDALTSNMKLTTLK